VNRPSDRSDETYASRARALITKQRCHADSARPDTPCTMDSSSPGARRRLVHTAENRRRIGVGVPKLASDSNKLYIV